MEEALAGDDFASPARPTAAAGREESGAS